MRPLNLDIAALVVNSKNHGYDAVERVKISSQRIADLLKREAGSKDHGYLVLETCSRFEIYLSGSEDPLSSLLQRLRRGISDLTSIDPKIYRGRDLLIHMLRVLSGAESLAPLEMDVVNQARGSLSKALSEGSLDKHLHALFREAIEASIDIRRSLGVSGSIGIPEVAVMVAKEILGPLARRRIAIIGTGEVARRIASALRSDGVKAASVVGRTLSGAETVARIFPDGRIHTPSEIPRVISGNDLVFLATSAREPIVSSKDVRDNGEGLFIDLGNPRNMDLGARDLLGDRYLWLDSLEKISRKILGELYRKLEDLDSLIQSSMWRLEARLILENMRLGINSYARLLEGIRRSEVERAVTALRLDQRQREVLDMVTSSIVNKALGALAEILENQATHGSFSGGWERDR